MAKETGQKKWESNGPGFIRAWPRSSTQGRSPVCYWLPLDTSTCIHETLTHTQETHSSTPGYPEEDYTYSRQATFIFNLLHPERKVKVDGSNPRHEELESFREKLHQSLSAGSYCSLGLHYPTEKTRPGQNPSVCPRSRSLLALPHPASEPDTP